MKTFLFAVNIFDTDSQYIEKSFLSFFYSLMLTKIYFKLQFKLC